MIGSRAWGAALLSLLTVTAAPAEEPSDGTPWEVLRRAEAKTASKEWAEAVPLWERVVEGNPYRAQSWYALGQTRYHAKEHRDAIPAFTKALELGAGYPFNSAYNIACCHALLGDKEAALRWLQKALDLGFRSLDEIRSDADLKSLRDDERFKKMAAVVDVGKMSRDEGWRYDLELLAREVKRRHYAPFRKVTRDEFEAQVKKLHGDIPKLTDDQITAAFMKLMRRVGDGHTAVWPHALVFGARSVVPVQFYLFTEGLFITDADAKHADLAGAQVLRVGDHPVEKVLEALEQITPQDNAMGPRLVGPVLLRFPPALSGLGLIKESNALPLTLRDAGGKERQVTLTADTRLNITNPYLPDKAWASARKGAAAPEPLYLKDRSTAYWFEYLPKEKTVYFQYNVVRDDGKEKIEKFSERLFRFINSTVTVRGRPANS